jgi:hypothetical protein
MWWALAAICELSLNYEKYAENMVFGEIHRSKVAQLMKLPTTCSSIGNDVLKFFSSQYLLNVLKALKILFHVASAKAAVTRSLCGAMSSMVALSCRVY